MRVLVAACGSRGDVQPMLALALALRMRGHEPLLAATPTFASEAAAFGLPFVGAGQDVQQFLREHRERMNHRNPFDAVRVLNEAIRGELQVQLDAFIPLARGMDLVVAGGAVLGARTAAEAAGLPYRYIAYTPQILPSAHHMPIMVPLTRAPRWLNRLGWAVLQRFYNPLVLPGLNARRRQLGLEPVSRSFDHIFSPECSLVAADPELFPVPPDVPSPQAGSFCLTDERVLSDGLERFLAAGEPPLYLGFGSMPDSQPERTTHLLVEAVRRAGYRAVLSSGWAGLGTEGLGPDIFVTGPVSHWLLFPRLGGVVHHGGAGTTAAAARAGVPQVVVPHAFDQFLLAERVRQANLGVSLPRRKLTTERLARALTHLRRDATMRETAARTGERIRQRDALAAAVEWLERSLPRA